MVADRDDLLSSLNEDKRQLLTRLSKAESADEKSRNQVLNLAKTNEQLRDKCHQQTLSIKSEQLAHCADMDRIKLQLTDKDKVVTQLERAVNALSTAANAQQNNSI